MDLNFILVVVSPALVNLAVNVQLRNNAVGRRKRDIGKPNF